VWRAALVRRTPSCDDGSVKGDRVEIVVDVGDGTRTYEIVATRAGRRVDVSNVRGVLEVSEVTRTGTVVRSGRFMAARVVAVIEYPAEDSEEPTRRRKPSSDQAALL
jgi:hypothetical protein